MACLISSTTFSISLRISLAFTLDEKLARQLVAAVPSVKGRPHAQTDR
jgi:hypothetical protein